MSERLTSLLMAQLADTPDLQRVFDQLLDPAGPELNALPIGWDATLGYMWKQWEFVTPTLFRTPGVDADKFINRSRTMMALLGVALAGVRRWVSLRLSEQS